MPGLPAASSSPSVLLNACQRSRRGDAPGERRCHCARSPGCSGRTGAWAKRVTPIRSQRGRLHTIRDCQSSTANVYSFPGYYLEEPSWPRYQDTGRQALPQERTMTETDKDELLRILESRGQQFLSAFASPVVMGKRKDTSVKNTRHAKKRKANSESGGEWSGIGSSSESAESNGEVSESGEGASSRRP